MEGTKVNIIENALINLKNSTMFNLSMASKELFHSNFLYYILNKYKPTKSNNNQSIKDFISKLFEISDWQNYNIYREKHNFDLLIVFDNKVLLVLENKVKSMPEQNQLEKYKIKAESIKYYDEYKKEYRLLSIYPAKFENWIYINYKEYSIILKETLTESDDIEEYDRLVIKDYVRFIDNICTLVECFSLYDNNSDIFMDNTYLSLTNDKDVEDIYKKNVDFFLKFRANQFCFLLKENVPGHIYSSSYQPAGILAELNISLKKDPSLNLHIWLQGTRFVLGISSNEFSRDVKEITEKESPSTIDCRNFMHNMYWYKVLEKVLSDNLWFNFDKLKSIYKNTGPEKNSGAKYFTWMNFHHEYFYRYVDLDRRKSISVKDMLDNFVYYEKQAKKNAGKIMEIFDNFGNLERKDVQ